MDQALFQHIQDMQHAAYFRCSVGEAGAVAVAGSAGSAGAGACDAASAGAAGTAAGGAFSRVVDSPFLGGPIASAFERLSRFADPVVEIARLGIHEVHNVCWGVDAVRDSLDDLDNIATWTREGAIGVRHMAGGRC